MMEMQSPSTIEKVPTPSNHNTSSGIGVYTCRTMLRREKYWYKPAQAQHGKAQAIDGGDAVNACKLHCNIYKYAMEWNIYSKMHDICNIYSDA